MKNFLRALRHSWPYRKRLGLSVACALMAAFLWSLNFTAIYPVLKILGNEQTLQEWVEKRIEDSEKEIDAWHTELEQRRREARMLDRQPETSGPDQELAG